jgi:hypothetical protein
MPMIRYVLVASRNDAVDTEPPATSSRLAIGGGAVFVDLPTG